jgi:hypothetical protein
MKSKKISRVDIREAFYPLARTYFLTINPRGGGDKAYEYIERCLETRDNEVLRDAVDDGELVIPSSRSLDNWKKDIQNEINDSIQDYGIYRWPDSHKGDNALPWEAASVGIEMLRQAALDSNWNDYSKRPTVLQVRKAWELVCACPDLPVTTGFGEIPWEDGHFLDMEYVCWGWNAASIALTMIAIEGKQPIYHNNVEVEDQVTFENVVEHFLAYAPWRSESALRSYVASKYTDNAPLCFVRWGDAPSDLLSKEAPIAKQDFDNKKYVFPQYIGTKVVIPTLHYDDGSTLDQVTGERTTST